MDVQTATNNYRMNQWMDLIRKRSESGLTIDQFCEEIGVTRNAYYYWQRKIRASLIESASSSEEEVPAQFAEVCPPSIIEDNRTADAMPAFVPQMIIRTGCVEIGIGADTPRVLLESAMKAVLHAQ